MPTHFPDPEPHAPSARVAASRIPWRRLGALVLAAVVGLLAWAWRQDRAPGPDARSPVPATTLASPRAWVPESVAPPALPAARAAPWGLPRFAEFGNRRPPPDVRHVADWAVDSGDHGEHAFVIVDKKRARVWLFGPEGRLLAATPALVGAAVGDDPVPGIGEKPLAQVLPEEKTTPAGRYVAEPGVNANGEDIVWVSYDLAVSLHRVRPTVAAERRLQRLASATARDNRISFGCINLPVDFYEKHLSPTVRRHGAIVYVLPETRTAQEQFGTYDVAARDPIASFAHMAWPHASDTAVK